MEQVLRQIGDKDQKIQNLEALLQKSKENISLLEKEREDLYAKIQAGEGETAVLNQLQEKNHALQEQVSGPWAPGWPPHSSLPVAPGPVLEWACLPVTFSTFLHCALMAKGTHWPQRWAAQLRWNEAAGISGAGPRM